MLADQARERIIVALDCGRDQALDLADTLCGHARWLKVGMTLYYAEGPAIVQVLRDRGFKVFLDLKFHDIPHQVRGAARAAALAGADLLSVHGFGAASMLAAARAGVEEAAEARGSARAKLVAITVLTSMDEAAMAQVGLTCPIAEQVERLASLAFENGIDGVVCSPREAASMRARLGEGALVVTPGVRPAGAALGDQSRVATPADAIGAGASHLVIGRPITGATDPVGAYEAVVSELCAG